MLVKLVFSIKHISIRLSTYLHTLPYPSLPYPTLYQLFILTTLPPYLSYHPTLPTLLPLTTVYAITRARYSIALFGHQINNLPYPILALYLTFHPYPTLCTLPYPNDLPTIHSITRVRFNTTLCGHRINTLPSHSTPLYIKHIPTLSTQPYLILTTYLQSMQYPG